MNKFRFQLDSKQRTRPLKAIITWIIMMTMFGSLAGIANPGAAKAVCGSVGVPSDTLTIKVGYYGGPYYTKKVYTLSDFDTLPQVEQAYTFIDSLNAVIIDSAKGVTLTDLMEDSGIDVNSVQKFYFYCTDINKGWYQCLDKAVLLDTPRYFYPNLPSHWDYEAQSALPEAIDGAIRVVPMIAYKDNWKRYADSPDYSNYDTSTRFRLLFGQTDTVEQNAPQSAKWIHSIEVMLGGMPPDQVTLNKSQADVKVGSMVQLQATVAPYEATDKSVTWNSSDTSVATVDKNGLVTVVGKGTAAITVTTVVGNLTATCVVNGPKKSTGNQGIVSAGSNSQKQGPPGTESKLQHLTEKNGTANALAVEAGIQPWRVVGMSADAVPLEKQKEENIMDIFALIIFIMLLFSGAFKQYKEYIRETGAATTR